MDRQNHPGRILGNEKWLNEVNIKLPVETAPSLSAALSVKVFCSFSFV